MLRFIGSLGLIALLALFAELSTASVSAAASPGVIPPSSQPGGQSYGEWSAAWWRWAYQTPVHGPNDQVKHPLALGSGAVDCSWGQSGRVWFLAGTLITSASATGDVINAVVDRSCAIPPGITLMFPTLNSEYDNVQCPPTPPTTLDV